MPETTPEVKFLISLGIKVGGAFVAFVSGVVTATWVVASKIKGFDDRLQFVEASQVRCQSENLGEIKESLDKINSKIDAIPDLIDTKLSRAHDRIDNVLMRDGGDDPRP